MGEVLLKKLNSIIGLKFGQKSSFGKKNVVATLPCKLITVVRLRTNFLYLYGKIPFSICSKIGLLAVPFILLFLKIVKAHNFVVWHSKDLKAAFKTQFR